MSNERFISYAQTMEDVMLWRALQHVAPGTYIDVGASDPTDLSVTRAFYDRGWSGLNVEPLPEQAARLSAARPRDVTIQAALSDHVSPTRPFYRVTLHDQTGLSTTHEADAERHRTAGATIERIEVPVTTLATLCRDHVRGPVHFLKIDAEGAEAAVLAGADLRAVRPWIIVIEATPPLDHTAAAPAWGPALLAAGYHQVWFDGLNRFYLADEHADLARHFTLPPNVFDGFVVYDPPFQQHLAAVRALSERRLAVIEELEARLAAREAVDEAGPVESMPAAKAPLPSAPPLAPAVGVPPTHQAVGVPPTQHAVGVPPTQQAVGVPPVQQAVGQRANQQPIDLRPAAPQPVGPPARPQGIARRAAWLVYRLVRPILRPMAWRARTFMTGHLQQELDGQRIRLDQLVARPVHTSSASGSALDPTTLAALERMLLTLAVLDGRNRDRPGLAPVGLSKPPIGKPPIGKPPIGKPGAGPLGSVSQQGE